MTPVPTRSPRLRGDRGSVTAETAVVLPVIVVLAVVLAFVGLAGAQQVRVDASARAAARELARGEDEAAAVEAARQAAVSAVDVSVSRDGPWVHVEVTRTLRPAARGMLAGLEVEVTGRAVARLESQLVAAAGASP